MKRLYVWLLAVVKIAQNDPHIANVLSFGLHSTELYCRYPVGELNSLTVAGRNHPNCEEENHKMFGSTLIESKV